MSDRCKKERLRLRKKRANTAYLKREKKSHRIHVQAIRTHRSKLGLCHHCGKNRPLLNHLECGKCSGSSIFQRAR
jgi:hypothetical protein